MPSAPAAVVVYCTFPDPEQAAAVARGLVEDGLAACINLIPAVRSIYRWKGEVCDDAEVLGVIKTTAGRFEALRDSLVERHPYDCPEVIAVEVAAGHPAYLEWLSNAVVG